MINVLFVSCYSPYINNSASIELIYYMNLLSNSGEYNVYLLTMDFPKDSIYYDTNMEEFLHKDIKVHKISGGIILNKMLPRVSKENSQSSGNRKSFLIKIKNLFLVVDPYLSWANNAFGYFKKNLKNIKFDFLVGMHEPPSSLICSRRIKKFIDSYAPFRTRFISYFSDPYCDEISRKNKNFFVRKLNEVIESKIVSSSDKFLFVTEKNFEYYKSKYDITPNNVELIHRNFDENIYNEINCNYPEEFSKDKINFLYAGDIVRGVRDVTNFGKALDFILENHKEEFKNINVNFYGNINDDYQLKFIKDRKYINVFPRVSYSKIIKLMLNADVLIVFGNKQFNQIPAKIYDYLGTTCYILVILETYEDSLYNFVKDIYGVECVLNDCIKISETIINYIKRFRPTQRFKRDYCNSKVILDRFKSVFYN